MSNFKSLLHDAKRVVSQCSEAKASVEEASEVLDQHFPGLLGLTKELGNDIPFMAEMGSNCDMLAATYTDEPENVLENMEKVVKIQSSEYGKLHRNAIRYGLTLGLEIGYILSKLYDKQSMNDDEFEKFMKGLHAE